MNKRNRQISWLVVPASMGLLLLASSATARAGQDGYGAAGRSDLNRYACSSQTIAGRYGWTAEGALIGTPGLPVTTQFRSIGIAQLDGRGNLTWLERTVINGHVVNSDFTEASGTYSVNPNCTGTATIYTPYSPVPLNLALVIIKRGREFRAVLTTDAITTVFTKLE